MAFMKTLISPHLHFNLFLKTWEKLRTEGKSMKINMYTGIFLNQNYTHTYHKYQFAGNKNHAFRAKDILLRGTELA